MFTVLSQAKPAKLKLAFFAAHVIAARNLLNWRFAFWAFPIY